MNEPDRLDLHTLIEAAYWNTMVLPGNPKRFRNQILIHEGQVFVRERLEYIEHHLWCSMQVCPVSQCAQCRYLWEKFPYTNEEERRCLAAKHFFPDIVMIN
jgi:hypothetical protein